MGKLRVVELGKRISPYLKGKDWFYFENFICYTEMRCNEEPERSDEYEEPLLDFILTLAAGHLEKHRHIESLVCRYYIDEMVRKRRGNMFKLLDLMPQIGMPLWKLKVKAFFASRDYRHTWWDRLKTCIAVLTVMHLLACLLIPDIRNWTLDIIVRCNEEYFREYFNYLAEWHGLVPRQEVAEPLILYLSI